MNTPMSMQWLHASLVREGPFLTATRPLHRSAKQFYADPLKERIIEIPLDGWPVPSAETVAEEKAKLQCAPTHAPRTHTHARLASNRPRAPALPPNMGLPPPLSLSSP